MNKKCWKLTAAPECLPESRAVPAIIKESDIAEAVVQLKGAAATLDAAAAYGPDQSRELCRQVSAGVLGMLREVGL